MCHKAETMHTDHGLTSFLEKTKQMEDILFYLMFSMCVLEGDVLTPAKPSPRSLGDYSPTPTWWSLLSL